MSVDILFKGLKKEGHDVRILTLSCNHKEGKEGDVYFIGSLDASIVYPYARIVYPQRSEIIKELIEWKPDIIHTHCELSSFACACYISRKCRIPIVHTYHTAYEEYAHYVPFGGSILVKLFLPNILRLISGKTKLFIVPSEKMRQKLITFKFPSQISVIPSAINDRFIYEDYSEYRNIIREKYGIKDEECIFLFLGRVAREKNIKELIEYADCDELTKFRIMICGSGPYLKRVKKECAKRGISDRVIFTGMVSPEEVPKYYSAGDIFINASVTETQGLTYMEAMACTLPVLCRNDKCLEGVIENEKNGFVYNNREEFLQYASELTNECDLRKKVGKNAREMVCEKYNSGKYVKSCEKIYAGLL